MERSKSRYVVIKTARSLSVFFFYQEPAFDAENNEKSDVLTCPSSPISPENTVRK